LICEDCQKHIVGSANRYLYLLSYKSRACICFNRFNSLHDSIPTGKEVQKGLTTP